MRRLNSRAKNVGRPVPKDVRISTAPCPVCKGPFFYALLVEISFLIVKLAEIARKLDTTPKIPDNPLGREPMRNLLRQAFSDRFKSNLFVEQSEARK